jgi:hypothetical protein
MSSTAGIVDTGTTLIYLPTDAYNKYKSATGATLDSTTGLLRITSSQYSSLKSLVFTIGGKTYSLTANGQIWPRSLNSYIGGSSSYIYLVVNDVSVYKPELILLHPLTTQTERLCFRVWP